MLLSFKWLFTFFLIFISGCVNDQPGGSDTLSAVKPLNEEVTVKKMGTKGQRRCATPFLGTTWNRTLVTLFKRCVSVLLSRWLSKKLAVGALEFPCFSFKPRASPDILQFWLLQHLENSFESNTLITYLSAGLWLTIHQTDIHDVVILLSWSRKQWHKYLLSVSSPV